MNPGSVPPPPPVSEERSPPPTMGWFVGDIEPAPISRRYRAAMAAVAIAMVLLPLLYVGLIGFVGWAVWWHAVNDLSWLGNGGLIQILLYVGPLLVGGILLLFLIKQEQANLDSAPHPPDGPPANPPRAWDPRRYDLAIGPCRCLQSRRA